jgi:hypothetical protein
VRKNREKLFTKELSKSFSFKLSSLISGTIKELIISLPLIIVSTTFESFFKKK